MGLADALAKGAGKGGKAGTAIAVLKLFYDNRDKFEPLVKAGKQAATDSMHRRFGTPPEQSELSSEVIAKAVLGRVQERGLPTSRTAMRSFFDPEGGQGIDPVAGAAALGAYSNAAETEFSGAARPVEREAAGLARESSSLSAALLAQAGGPARTPRWSEPESSRWLDPVSGSRTHRGPLVIAVYNDRLDRLDGMRRGPRISVGTLEQVAEARGLPDHASATTPINPQMIDALAACASPGNFVPINDENGNSIGTAYCLDASFANSPHPDKPFGHFIVNQRTLASSRSDVPSLQDALDGRARSRSARGPQSPAATVSPEAGVLQKIGGLANRPEPSGQRTRSGGPSF